MRTFFVFALSIIVLSNCQRTDETAEPAQDEFAVFYAKFHSDSLYQMEHIQFPLLGISSRPEEHSDTFRWQQEDWQMHRLFDPEKSGFLSDFSIIGDDLIIEKIVHKKGMYGMERRFARLDGDQWFLIYYAALHPISAAG